MRPRWIVIENVLHMRNWPRYQEFLSELQSLGYLCCPQILNSADFGVPQSRRRLFILCERGQEPPNIAFPSSVKVVPARDIIDTNGAFRYTPLRSDRRAAATIKRAERAIAGVGPKRPFILVYYSSDGAGGWQPLTSPLRTITTLDRFAYVRCRAGMHEMRMLQVPELRLGMGFPPDYLLGRGVRRDRIRLLGNAVCPPVMACIVRTLTGGVDSGGGLAKGSQARGRV
jgi:DNA (cytosine-5)-methyltransferase 1